MRIKNTDALIKLVAKLFAANGVEIKQAAEVAEILTQTTMLGFSSHGIYRTKQYIDEIKNGGIAANAPIESQSCGGAVAIVDGNWNFGQLTAKAAALKAIELAKQYGVSFVACRKSNHIGGLSVYTRMMAEAGCAAMGWCGTNGGGYWVAPFGGMEGRMATDPISFAAPTDNNNQPVALDFATSMVSEGKLRLMRDAGEKVPGNLAVDCKGSPITDPADYYGPPRGAILPFGESQGYKGTGLAVMCQILSGLLCGANWKPDADDINLRGNAMSLIAIDIGHMTGLDGFKRELTDYSDFVRSAKLMPGFKEIVLPGDFENRKLKDNMENGIDIDDVTRDVLLEMCGEYGVLFDVE